MEAVARLKNAHMSARKMRLVADLIRGKKIGEALDILKFSKKEAGTWLEKVLLSAIANWEDKLGGTVSADEYDLYVSEAYVDQGPQLKRFRPAPHGRAHRIRKHSCHINIAVTNRIALENESAEVEEVAAAE